MCDALEEIFEEKYRSRLDAEVQKIAAEKAEEIATKKAEEIATQKAEQKTQALGNLISKLIKLGRIDDAEKAATDVVYRESLYEEFGLV